MGLVKIMRTEWLLDAIIVEYEPHFQELIN